MFGNVFFRDFPYKLVTHARVFSLSFVDTNINPKAALFISVNMQFLNKIFSYSNMASWQKIKKLGLAVFVPFKNEKIDFEYMEKFINILEEERLQILETYLQVNSLDNCQLTDAEQVALDKVTNKDIKFKEFYIGDLFYIKKGKRLTKEHMISGNINFLAAISSNNGIREKIKTDIVWAPNCISVNYNGSVGCSYYQEEPFYASDDVNLCYATDSWKLNKKIALYYCTILKKYTEKFDYTQKWNKERMSKTSILLPINRINEIDYDFMETYIKAIEKKVIQKVITWKDSEMKTLKTVS